MALLSTLTGYKHQWTEHLKTIWAWRIFKNYWMYFMHQKVCWFILRFLPWINKKVYAHMIYRLLCMVEGLSSETTALSLGYAVWTTWTSMTQFLSEPNRAVCLLGRLQVAIVRLIKDICLFITTYTSGNWPSVSLKKISIVVSLTVVETTWPLVKKHPVASPSQCWHTVSGLAASSPVTPPPSPPPLDMKVRS